MKAQLFDITHTTTYDYRSPVTVAHHLLRLAPRQLRRQIRYHHWLHGWLLLHVPLSLALLLLGCAHAIMALRY